MIRLKNILRINSVSSGVTGLLLVLFSGFIADLFGASKTAPFTGVGLFLLLFAVYVYLQALKEPIQTKNIRLIIAIDTAWVIGSLIIILPGLFGLFIIGYILIGAVAAWVSAMAFLQSRGLKELT